jgi:hypothetical protein
MDKFGFGEAFLIGIFFCVCLFSNNVNSTHSIEPAAIEPIEGQRLDRNKPTIYISFKEFVRERGANAEQHSVEGVRFAFHNNTRWIIYYHAIPKASLPGDVPLIYKIEQQSGCPDNRHLIGDMVVTDKLNPGKSISFVVPRGHLLDGGKIYVEFNYSWELISGRPVHPQELRHRVYFASMDLPSTKR